MMEAYSAGEPQDQSQRALRPRPELPHERLAARANETAQNKRDHDRVIELPRDRNEIRHEIERERQIADQREEEQLPASGHARVASKTTNQDDAIRDQCRQRPSVFPTAHRDQPAEKRGVEQERHSERDQQPKPPRHPATLNGVAADAPITRPPASTGPVAVAPFRLTAVSLGGDGSSWESAPPGEDCRASEFALDSE